MASDDLAPVVRSLANPSEQEVERLVSLLVRVFEGDIAMQAFTGRDKAIERLIHRLTIKHSAKSGQCLVARSAHNASEIYGVAAWLAPGDGWDFHSDPAFLAALDPSLREWYNAHYASKYNELRNCLDMIKKEKNSWALKVLAVVPESRRKGVGKALIDVIAKKANSNGELMITDVRDPSTVHFFQRLGFKYRCVKNVTSQGSPGFPVWSMYRDTSQGARSSSSLFL